LPLPHDDNLPQVTTTRHLRCQQQKGKPSRAELDGRQIPITLTSQITALAAREIAACVIVAESRVLPRLVAEHRELLRGRPVLLAPGGLAGALRLAELEPSVQAAEATGFPAAGFAQGDLFVLRGIKQNLPIATAQAQRTAELHAVFARHLPTLVPSDLVTTSMANTNHLIHPPITLLNAVRVDGAHPFRLYREGVSPALNELLEAVDIERRAVCRAVGADDRRGRDWLHGFYHHDGMEGETLAQCLQSYPGFESVPGPGTLDYRYLTDDIPHGVAQWSALGRRLGVPTPAIDHVLEVLRILAPDLDLVADEQGLELFLRHVEQTAAAQPVPAGG
ncbi:NAD/NADP octopine/nopaline dehydrogenase family protein, partial [Brachybacterium sp. UMB0905]|uniref:NAD/NADP octopine/nopaline dehydrogenase family protein n=1 Tax=Brachybacterium sp. UMB0905 TaxID=2069310 RepID=UPI000C80B74E